MSEKQHEALDESDLHQNVSQANSNEIKQANRTKLLVSSAHRQGSNQKSQHGHQRNGQNHSQDSDAKVDFPVHPLLQRARTQNLAEFQVEEEERSVVGDGGDVVGVASRKTMRIIKLDQLGKRMTVSRISVLLATYRY